MERPLRIAIVAGEASGDTLGAGLMESLLKRHPNIEFAGIGGESMISHGFQSLFPIERLSVMGFSEVIGRLFELICIRKALRRWVIDWQPDVFIGIDAPDFNLDLELALKNAGITTVHYVSPSVWAWRQGRIKKIKKAVNHMLTFLPFEADFYRQHQVPVSFIGHTLADKLPQKPLAELLKQAENSTQVTKTLAVLPGSRSSEVEKLGTLFLQVAEAVKQELGSLNVVIPTPNRARTEQVRAIIANQNLNFNVEILEKQSDEALRRADAVLVASGTATLQTMLLKKPMVVAYKMSAVSFKIISLLAKTKWVSLPNILEQDDWIPERLQEQATVEQLKSDVIAALTDSTQRAEFLKKACYWHEQLALNADDQAAAAVMSLIKK
ncbi:lipid-A-disaccharide synthase [Reinekea forsetii]|nr:lipid-A-disaccharide synthase [Reinekea forsetii]